jgi:hypothetical protein
MALGSDGSSLVVAYVPGLNNNQRASEIVLSTSSRNGLPTLACAGWTIKWSIPTNNGLDSQAVVCTPGASRITVGTPPFCPLGETNPDCDWVLEMQRTGTALAGPSPELTDETLEAWADLSPEDGTSAIIASLVPLGDPEQARAILVSAAGEAFQQSPRVARLANGDYIVVWQAEGLDGSLEGIFAQRLDGEGQLIGSRMLVNTTTEHHQVEPAVASAATGEAVVVWSSYGQDGDLGGIFGRRFDRFGIPVAAEFPIDVKWAGHQAKPQIGMDAAGNFAVAWNTEPGEEVASAVSLRLLGGDGEPVTEEIRIGGSAEELRYLVDLRVDPLGSVALQWALEDFDGTAHGQFVQEFDATGLALGPPTEVTP